MASLLWRCSFNEINKVFTTVPDLVIEFPQQLNPDLDIELPSSFGENGGTRPKRG